MFAFWLSDQQYQVHFITQILMEYMCIRTFQLAVLNTALVTKGRGTIKYLVLMNPVYIDCIRCPAEKILYSSPKDFNRSITRMPVLLSIFLPTDLFVSMANKTRQMNCQNFISHNIQSFNFRQFAKTELLPYLDLQFQYFSFSQEAIQSCFQFSKTGLIQGLQNAGQKQKRNRGEGREREISELNKKVQWKSKCLVFQV